MKGAYGRCKSDKLPERGRVLLEPGLRAGSSKPSAAYERCTAIVMDSTEGLRRGPRPGMDMPGSGLPG